VKPSCPCLVRETSAYRGTLDLSVPAQYEVVSTWHCRHPFHGIRLELGDSRVDVEQVCAACTLPRPQSDRDEK
jgi:hypothetical protein